MRLLRVLVAAGVLALPFSVQPAAAAQPVTWNFTQADVMRGQSPGRGGAGITVAVIDSWVDGSHPDFGGRVLPGADCIGGCRGGPAPPDACYHGTHVAGIIASATYGVAPLARILPVTVLRAANSSGSQCTGTTADVAAGITWAATHGARVINMSLGEAVPGLLQSTAVTDAVRAAAARGIVVTIAAGNAGLPITDNYGGSALVVAATGPNGQLASYSDSGSGVSVAAPGGDTGVPGQVGLAGCQPSDCIASTLPHDSYGLLEGTSMAAPAVAGEAALLLAQDPTRGLGDVLHAITSTAHPLAGAGAGLIDVGAALALRPGSPAPSGSGTTTTAGSGPATPVPVPTPRETTAGTGPGGGSPGAASGWSGGGPALAGTPSGGGPLTVPAWRLADIPTANPSAPPSGSAGAPSSGAAVALPSIGSRPRTRQVSGLPLAPVAAAGLAVTGMVGALVRATARTGTGRLGWLGWIARFSRLGGGRASRA